MGLVSYFKTSDKSLLPEVVKNEVLGIEMSDYQFLNYSRIRKAEIEQDKNKKKKTKGKKEDEEKEGEKSSYRAYSRMHCSFVFPESIPRPYPRDELEGEDLEAFEETRGNPDEDNYVDVFTPEAVTKICEAAVKVAATQKVAKKIIIEKAVQTTAKEFKVEASVNKSKSQGR